MKVRIITTAGLVFLAVVGGDEEDPTEAIDATWSLLDSGIAVYGAWSDRGDEYLALRFNGAHVLAVEALAET